MTTPLTMELLRWVASRPRTYPETIEAWRSNCPRDPVWDDAVMAGLVRIVPSRNGNSPTVVVTTEGRALLDG
jgi:hypothetical protein